MGICEQDTEVVFKLYPEGQLGNKLSIKRSDSHLLYPIKYSILSPEYSQSMNEYIKGLMNGVVRYLQIYPHKILPNDKGRRNNFCMGDLVVVPLHDQSEHGLPMSSVKDVTR